MLNGVRKLIVSETVTSYISLNSVLARICETEGIGAVEVCFVGPHISVPTHFNDCMQLLTGSVTKISTFY